MSAISSRKLSRLGPSAAALVIVLALAACGGGGGGGGGLNSTPRAPPAPTPDNPPSASPGAVISAPARATTGAGPSPVLATPGGPSFTSGPTAGTAFPLLQTTLVLDHESIDADTAGNAAGGTATVEAGQLKVIVANRFEGAPDSGHANLDWTRVGYWSTGGFWDCDLCHRGAFVAGYQTPEAAIPASGTATYTGVAEGAVFYPTAGGGSGTIPSNGEEVQLTGGAASLTADFGARSVSGSITGMTARGAPWNNIGFNATIAGSAFSGGTSVTNAPGGGASLAGSATGTIEGRFFGPVAQEAGAVWTLFDGAKAAIGTLSGKRP